MKTTNRRHASFFPPPKGTKCTFKRAEGCVKTAEHHASRSEQTPGYLPEATSGAPMGIRGPSA